MRGPEDKVLHRWLRLAAEAMPDACAIEEEQHSTTFRELHQQAASLALCWIQHSVQPGDRIALVLPKTTDAITCVFASLMAGAIYVPIHPRWPQERIEAVLTDCSARLVVETDGTILRVLDRHTGCTVPWPAEPAATLDAGTLPRVDAEDVALILFTSGSTGTPKGVVLSHRAVNAFVAWTAEEFRIGASDRIACPAPLGFDLSTFDIFNMALRGATAVLVPDSIAWMPRFLAAFVREAGITCWYSVPSMLSLMLHEGRFAAHAYPNLRLVLFAGEVFPGPRLASLQAVIPHARYANLYGPTETNVVTWYDVPHGFDGMQPPPIGRSCPYASVRVDPDSGELLAGGDSLMAGYWNRPEETRSSFARVEGTTYYRTGDRVSLNADGDLLFCGRMDRQVKRRGFRIELGEIEAALLRNENLLEAAVVAAEDTHQSVVIIAFLRSRAPGATSVAETRTFLSRRLPTYMLPDTIVFIPQMPKGNRGKIDYGDLRRIAQGMRRGHQD